MTDIPGEARFWADHRHDLARSARHLRRDIRDAFAALTAIQYSAPWKRS